jgi:hypothetical protein
MYDIHYSITNNPTIKYIPDDDCYIKCIEKAKQYTIFDKIIPIHRADRFWILRDQNFSSTQSFKN